MLSKQTNITFIPGSPGQPFIPASAPHPAYCETKTITQLEYVVVLWRVIRIDDGADLGLTVGQAPPGTFLFPVKGVFKEVTRTETVCYPASAGTPGQPAIPPTPSQWNTDFNIGWNAGAHSITRLFGDVQLTFKVPIASGVIVGFNHTSQGVGFNEITHGIFFKDGVAQVRESGVAKGAPQMFAPQDLFYVERVNGVVSYYREAGAVPPRTLFYQSAVTSTSSSLIVDCSLFAGGDKID